MRYVKLAVYRHLYESVEHSIDCKENYLGLEMPMCSFVSLASLIQKLPLNIFLIIFLQSTCCMQMNLCVFFSVNCLTCVLFTGIYPIPVKRNNSSHMQKQELEYV